jgi:uncharacterized protein (DUF58 family)
MVAEFHYRLPDKARSRRPGAHLSKMSGGGMIFRRHVSLLVSPDPRRLDVRASLRDPAEQWWVREYQQRAAIPVVVVLDVSTSMGFRGLQNRARTASIFVEAAAWSANRHGDRFGLIGFDRRLREDCWVPVRQQRAALEGVIHHLRHDSAREAGHEGLAEVPAWLPREPGLVFMVSDFHWPVETLRGFLESSMPHHVVPVVLWDRAEYSGWPTKGFAFAEDMESAERRLVWLRSGWNDAVGAAYAQREADLRAVCEPFATRPLFLRDGFSADVVSDYFQGLAA